MPQNHYSTTTAADWILHHYFFGRKHRYWFAPEFHPYRKPNPRSSNPMKIYEDLFETWRDNDDHAAKILDKRITLVKKINWRRDHGLLEEALAAPLRETMGNLPIRYFFPFVVRIDGGRIAPARRTIAGSGASAGSEEFVVNDLDEAECAFLFLDSQVARELKTIFLDTLQGNAYLDSMTALETIRQSMIVNEQK